MKSDKHNQQSQTSSKVTQKNKSVRIIAPILIVARANIVTKSCPQEVPRVVLITRNHSAFHGHPTALI